MLIQLHLPSKKVMTGFWILLKLQQISYGIVMVQDHKYSCFGTRITAIKWTGLSTRVQNLCGTYRMRTTLLLL